jgi:membrane protease YdiL (CAAX protease family)
MDDPNAQLPEESPSRLQSGGLTPTILERFNISPVLFGFLTLIVVFFLYQIIGGVITFLVLGMKPTLQNVTEFRIATALGQLILLLVPTLLLVRLASHEPARFLRLQRADARTFVAALVGIVSLQQLLQIYLWAQEQIPLPEDARRALDQFRQVIEEAYRILVQSDSVPELLVVLVVVALIPAIAEELLFRGLVQRNFEHGLTPTKGIILTGVIFGAYHLNPFGFVPLVVLGIYLGYLAFRARSIWVAVAAHFYNNAFASIAAYARVDDNSIVTGPPNMTPLPLLAVTFLVFGLVFAFSVYYFHRITQPVLSTAASTENA